MTILIRLGRLLRSMKTHLIEIAPILDLPTDAVQRMRCVNFERCEAILVAEIEGRCGGVVDGRAPPGEIYDVLEPCLTEEERGCLPPLDGVQSGPPPVIAKSLDACFASAPRALRMLESFGDNYIVLLVPRARLSEFDHASRFWAV
jgi:hypothetical protein